MQFRQLLPETASLDVGDLLGSLDLAADARDERPYTVVNFVSSVDGRATVQGRSGPLGDDGDRVMFHGLREQVDAVLVGTGTLRTERYGRILGKPERRERRKAKGLPPEPIACIITRSGDLPDDIPLFAEPEARVLVFAQHPIDLPSVSASVRVITLDPGEMTLTTALRHMRHDHGIRSLLCEGGPMLFSSLLNEGLVDELFLTLAPKLAGGGMEPAITMGTELPEPAELTLRWMLERNDSLYLRYALS
jgi:riboflavin-specific deaminase-like protein